MARVDGSTLGECIRNRGGTLRQGTALLGFHATVQADSSAQHSLAADEHGERADP